MWPFTSSRRAPNARIVSRMTLGVVAGAYTRTGIEAAAPYAASAAPALPAVGATRPGTPSALARVTAALIPRALKDAVGLSPSSLIHSVRTPAFLASDGVTDNGVPPSPSVAGASLSSSGRTALYRHMSQRSMMALLLGHGESYLTRYGCPHFGQTDAISRPVAR